MLSLSGSKLRSCSTTGESLSLLHKCDFHSNIILENVYCCFLFLSLCSVSTLTDFFYSYHFSVQNLLRSQRSQEKTPMALAPVVVAVMEKMTEISGRSLAMTSTLKQKTRLHKDPYSL